MLTLRLNKELESALDKAATRAGVSKSEFVRQCLEKFVAQSEPANLAWELGKDLFGTHGSGRGDLSRRRKELIREKIHARRGRH